ncbi:Uncharacterised protein [Salmonella enterica subsp. enterica]|uniref:Uncharacterized protein n=1 Tax=Salmonella enterica I TaxID=59201 RepID=A0A3S4K800_SALET|nr:Uncharacterised protein [Salmonella enterica subsp. enterica]
MNLYVIDTHAWMVARLRNCYSWTVPAGRSYSVVMKSVILNRALSRFTLNGDYIVDSLPSLIYTGL